MADAALRCRGAGLRCFAMDRFVVGTGRCGSTLLSRMLGQHPQVLSLFEYFNGQDRAKRFAPEPIDGTAFAELISAEQPFVTATLRRGHDVSEIIYPFESGGRYRREQGLPWVLVGTLPRLSDDPDALFDALDHWARRQPRRPVLDHHRALFAWLGERLGRPCWLERSGSSFDYLGQLAQHFPEARFLHIHRDGLETALSMVHHPAYRLTISLLYRAPLDDGTPLDALGPLDIFAAPRDGDALSRVLASRPEPERFGRYVSDQLLRGFRALAGIDAHRYAEVRFEDLVVEPHATLERVARFFELPDAGGWLERAAGLVKGAPALRAAELPEERRAALEEACRPGQMLLGRA